MITKYKKFKRGSKIPLFLRKIFLLIIGGIILLAIGFLIISNFKINKKRSELNSRVNSLKQEISVLEKRNEELKTQTSLILEEEYLEKEAREKLNLKKPGEKVVTIIPEEKENNKESLETIDSKSWWQNISEKLGF